MNSSSELNYNLYIKEQAKKCFYVCENIIMKYVTEEKRENLVVNLDGWPFEDYFNSFTEENAPTEEAKLFRKVRAELLENFSTKILRWK